jgi:hypothetical protein
MRSDSILWWVLALASIWLLSNHTYAENPKMFDPLLGASLLGGAEIRKEFSK